jgi:hypothetical protein
MKAASSWDYFARSESPNGLYEAVFDNAGEICMGGPAVGTLTVREKQTGRMIVSIDDANGAFVWSLDSSALAYPKWNSRRYQNLAVVWIPDATSDISDDTFRVLELESFENGIIQGVDSPIHRPQKINIQFTRRKK